MYNARGKSKGTGSSTISFPALHCWNPMTEVASIAAEMSDRRVMCRIAGDVLQKAFGPAGADPMQIVVANRPAIEAAARKLIERTAFADDGSIVIGPKDLGAARA